MIGNDVVDLKLAEIQSNWRRKGFLEKVFLKSEQKLIASESDRNSAVWLLWSMKEAAYKAHQREHSLPRQLNWKAQACELISRSAKEVRGVVQIKNKKYYTTTELTPEFIFTAAVNNHDKRIKSRCRMAVMGEIKEVLLSEVSANLGLPRENCGLVKDQHGVPSIYYKKKEIFKEFSLTGHGKFAAFTFSLTDC